MHVCIIESVIRIYWIHRLNHGSGFLLTETTDFNRMIAATISVAGYLSHEDRIPWIRYDDVNLKRGVGLNVVLERRWYFRARWYTIIRRSDIVLRDAKEEGRHSHRISIYWVATQRIVSFHNAHICMIASMYSVDQGDSFGLPSNLRRLIKLDNDIELRRILKLPSEVGVGTLILQRRDSTT